MGSLFHKLTLSCATLAGSLGVAGPAAAQEPPASSVIELSFDTMTSDGGANRVEFQGLRISQGDISVEAASASASALDYEHSEWQLSGDVEIVIGSARIESDEARFTIEDTQLTGFEVRGDPATFEALDAAGSEAGTGTASLISYDADEGTLSLTGNAWIRVGSTEATGCDLVYNLDEVSLRAGSADCSERFRMTIAVPPENSRAEDPPQAP